MNENKQVALMLSIPKSFRDKLRTMAAEQNLQNPDQVTSASTIAKEILCEYLDKIRPELQSLKAEDSNQSTKTMKPKEEKMT